MPKITIEEKEELTLRTLNAVENGVLIPVFYYVPPITSEEQELTVDVSYDGVKFTKLSAFKEFFTNFKVKVDSKIDRSYVMAHDLLIMGLPVIVKPLAINKQEITEQEALELLHTAIVTKDGYKEFKSKNLFNLKFITTGGYANINIGNGEEGSAYEAFDTAVTISTLAGTRGDSIALIEYPNFASEEALITKLESEAAFASYKYTACFVPWYTSNTYADDKIVERDMPACFGYLKAFAQMVRSNADWFATAGLIRGEIPDFKAALLKISEDTMHILQEDDGNLSVCVNAIYNTGSGYRIWGNRTFGGVHNRGDVTKAFAEFLNVRMLICDINKQIFNAAYRCTFEPNDDIVWLNFKSLVNTLLEQMRTGRGIKYYKWTKEVADDKAKIVATLTIRPIEAVEDFAITVYLTDQDETEIQESEV